MNFSLRLRGGVVSALSAAAFCFSLEKDLSKLDLILQINKLYRKM